eukprot:PhM_4_TR14915/c0_g1_i1/m.13875/K11353/NDUFA13; NADH dehydrogenase (ubiquinone) 1 alpha subcomplex subunit 13
MSRPNIPDDTKAFYTWFTGQPNRNERAAPGGYPAIRMYPVYGKRIFSGRTVLFIAAGSMIYGAWKRTDRERYVIEMDAETSERYGAYLPYQTSEINLRMMVSAYKRHRYEQENFIDKGYVGMTSEFRKFYYHDDVWRPDFHDVFKYPPVKYGGPLTSYNWALGHW